MCVCMCVCLCVCVCVCMCICIYLIYIIYAKLYIVYNLFFPFSLDQQFFFLRLLGHFYSLIPGTWWTSSFYVVHVVIVHIYIYKKHNHSSPLGFHIQKARGSKVSWFCDWTKSSQCEFNSLQDSNQGFDCIWYQR